MKRLAGNPGKRPLTGNTPPAWAKPPRPPKHLGAEARKEWKRMLAELERLGIAASCDRAALALYCQVYQRWVTAEEKLAKQSLVLQGADGGAYQNPYLAIANRAFDQLKWMLSEFGMTPSSRARIKVSGSEKDAFETFLQEAAKRKARKSG